jgi:hypothetical protein
MAQFLSSDEAKALGLPPSALVRAALKPSSGPTLWRMNGVGSTMLGSFADPRVLPAYFSMLWLTVLFIPVAPLGIYLVRHAGPRSFRFLGRIDAADFHKLYPGKMPRLVLSALGHAAAMFVCVVVALVVITVIFHWRR